MKSEATTKHSKEISYNHAEASKLVCIGFYMCIIGLIWVKLYKKIKELSYNNSYNLFFDCKVVTQSGDFC